MKKFAKTLVKVTACTAIVVGTVHVFGVLIPLVFGVPFVKEIMEW